METDETDKHVAIATMAALIAGLFIAMIYALYVSFGKGQEQLWMQEKLVQSILNDTYKTHISGDGSVATSEINEIYRQIIQAINGHNSEQLESLFDGLPPGFQFTKSVLLPETKKLFSEYLILKRQFSDAGPAFGFLGVHEPVTPSVFHPATVR